MGLPEILAEISADILNRPAAQMVKSQTRTAAEAPCFRTVALNFAGHSGRLASKLVLLPAQLPEFLSAIVCGGMESSGTRYNSLTADRGKTVKP